MKFYPLDEVKMKEVQATIAKIKEEAKKEERKISGELSLN
jgi:hypothetical protein